MKVLLTGASGFLGQHVLRCLQDEGVETVCLGRRRPAQFAGQFIEADLLAQPDAAALLRAAQPTHLLHLAWYAEHGKYWTSPLNLRWAEASVRLAEAFCAAGGRRLVAAGTCAEYDWSHGWCREESTPLAPATLYGTAKDACRRLMQAVCAQHSVAFAWARVFLPFGAGESAQRLVPSLASALQGRRDPFAVNAAAYRDFLHAGDVARAFVALLRSPAPVEGAFNLSSGQPVAIGEIVRTLASLLGADPQPILQLAAARPGEPALLAGDNSRLVQATGWRPALGLREGLALALQPSPPFTGEPR